jgi:hypothetical protein
MTIKTVAVLRRPLRLALLGLALPGLGLVARPAHADKVEPKRSPPAEVTRVLEHMLGTWSAKDLSAQMGPQAVKGTGKVTCERAAGGWAVRCHGQFQMGGMTIDEVQIVGWDSDAQAFHMYSANSMGDVHDHKGRLNGDTLELEYASSKGGKPYLEKLAFGVKGGKELTWKNTCTLDGQPLFSGQGTFRK